MNNRIEQLIRTSADVKLASAQDSHLLTAVQTVADELKSRLNAGGTVYLCGNGGSACDAMHFCEELTARFKRHRDGFRAMSRRGGSDGAAPFRIGRLPSAPRRDYLGPIPSISWGPIP